MEAKDIMSKIELASYALLEGGVSNMSLYIVGGAALSLSVDNFRATHDIDIISSLKNNDIRRILREYSINDDVAISVDPNFSQLFGYYENTSDLLIDIQGIKWYKVWAEVILLAKIHGTHDIRRKDIDDVKNSKLLELIDERRMELAVHSITKHMCDKHGACSNVEQQWREEAWKIMANRRKYEKNE